MEGVIPNSKVVIYPPPPGVDVSASGWRRELYLRPGQWIPLVTLTVVVVTAILAVIVGVLHWNEKVCILLQGFMSGSAVVDCYFPMQREDELERRRASHHINFDAL
jgi:integrin alpha FG-GAP repeat containing protein 1